jgi:hypothetical protein
VPPILADINYADARNGMESAIINLELALFDLSDVDQDA